MIHSKVRCYFTIMKHSVTHVNLKTKSSLNNAYPTFVDTRMN